MQSKIRLSFLLIVLLALAFGGLSPARADEGQPPADVSADTATLQRVWDVALGASASYPSDMVVFKGNLYFASNANNGYGREIWELGNPSGIDINPGAGGSNPTSLTVYNGSIYFGADGGDGAGQELWRFDWTNGAQRADNIADGSIGSYPSQLAVYQNTLYFQANGNDGVGVELWKYDPLNGAQRAADIASGIKDSYPTDLVVYQNEIYFHANGDDGTGDELWKYSPANGAQRVLDIYPGPTSSSPWFLTPYNNALYFTADGDNGAGRELWKYDPVNGAQLAADIAFGSTGSDPWWLGTYNGSLYFSRNYLLWKYDPVNGADQVLAPGCSYANLDPQYLVEYNNELYFNGDCNDGAGRELWKYNNTALAIIRSAKGYEGWLLESGENTSVGGTLNSAATTVSLGDDAQNRQFRSILSFDTSALPDNAVIISTRLKIRKQGLTGQNPFATHGNILIDIIKGAFSGNNALQLRDFQAAPGRANVGAIKNLPDVNMWFTAALSKLAFPHINKTGVTQLRLRFTKDDNNDNGADLLRFFCADSANLGDYPVLEIKYYIP